jgi:hypothetical protein
LRSIINATRPDDSIVQHHAKALHPAQGFCASAADTLSTMNATILQGTELERQTLRLYAQLLATGTQWGGALVVTAGAGCSATGMPAAVSIAGGCTLALDPDVATVKAVFRQGGLDFVVNTLDEALRVLKNEIRQHKPLSVALTAPLAETLAEMDERGVRADLRLDLRLALSTDVAAALELTDEAAACLDRHGYAEVSLSGAECRALEAAVLSQLEATDLPRRRWLERIAHYQRPQPGAPRLCWLTAVEQAALLPEQAAAVR